MDLKKLKSKTIQELILIALTYRISYKNMTILLNTEEIEIRKIFGSFLDMQEILHFLDLETRNEDEINSRVAYVNAKNYLSKRQLLMKELTLAKREGNIDKEKEVREKLSEHLKLVNDEFVMSTIGKNLSELTQEEKDAIARFRLKYATSKRWCADRLKRDKTTITRFDEELAERNPIFKEKIDLLDDYWYGKHKKITMEYARTRK